ncbi:hypothetical protein GCM10009624_02710 [Gordonia sinesedis]
MTGEHLSSRQPDREQVPAAVGRARQRVADARRAARLARVAAASELRARAGRRSRWFRRVLAGAALVAVALLVTVAVLGIVNDRAEGRVQTRSDVIESARAATITLLTSDPAQADRYVASALDVSTGDQRDRLERSRGELRAAVAAQSAPSDGQVLAAGLVTDPTGVDNGATADVLLVAAASNPALLGATADAERVTVTLTMSRADGRWKIARAVQS